MVKIYQQTDLPETLQIIKAVTMNINRVMYDFRFTGYIKYPINDDEEEMQEEIDEGNLIVDHGEEDEWRYRAYEAVQIEGIAIVTTVISYMLSITEREIILFARQKCKGDTDWEHRAGYNGFSTDTNPIDCEEEIFRLLQAQINDTKEA